MKLRVRKSEYQHAYASPGQEFFDTVYKDQVNYRMQRREKEHGHMIFKWESESSSSSDTTSIAEEETKEVSDEKTCDQDVLKERLDGLSENEERKEEKTFTVDSATQTPKTSRKSTARCRSRSQPSPCDKPPFVSYGWADDQKETGRKRTHNVHAPKQTVHAGALQRLNYNQQEKKKQKQKCLSRASSVLSKALFQKKQAEASVWQTEYQRCFSRQSERPDSTTSTKSKQSRLRSSRRSCRKKNVY
uniref:Centriole, cilia and spindle-associated protein n=1 Tax=Phallusia mammillata TaxID=59560 RepID=A0A6F9D9A6_9ASCI|nr:centriole, cilia and spindle-associated protein [Phallusia mammillata]